MPLTDSDLALPSLQRRRQKRHIEPHGALHILTLQRLSGREAKFMVRRTRASDGHKLCLRKTS